MAHLSPPSRESLDAILDHHQGPDDDPWCLPASMRFSPHADVLAMLCVSGGNLFTAEPVLRSLMRVAAMQDARVWVQMFEHDLVERFQPATDGLLNRLAVNATAYGGFAPPTIGGGGTDLRGCMDQTLGALPLPNGRWPDHLVLAFNGAAGEMPTPTVQGRTVPTTLLLPPGTLTSDARITRSLWAPRVAVVQLQDGLLNMLDSAVEGVALRGTLRELGDPVVPAPPRRRF